MTIEVYVHWMIVKQYQGLKEPGKKVKLHTLLFSNIWLFEILNNTLFEDLGSCRGMGVGKLFPNLFRCNFVV